MKTQMPLYKTPADLASAANADPGLVVLEQADETSKAVRKPTPPAGFVTVGSVGAGDERIMIYRREDVAPTP
jgi:hypothetical protein